MSSLPRWETKRSSARDSRFNRGPLLTIPLCSSLALISARKTVEANEVLSMLMSSHLYSVCQALDLRYIEFTFRADFNPTLLPSLTKHFSSFLSTSALATLAPLVIAALWRRLETTTSVDLVPRWDDAFAHASSLILDALASSSSSSNPIPAIALWRTTSAAAAVALMRDVRTTFFDGVAQGRASPTTAYLGHGTRKLYSFVRGTIGVQARRGDVFLGKQEQTVGTGVSRIFDSIKSGKMNAVLVDMMA